MSRGGVRASIRKGESRARSTDEIIDLIRSIIRDRSLQSGDRIGAERELAETLGVSRWIIRRALDDLARQNEILRTHGRSGGVFVAPQRVVRVPPLVRLPQYLQAQGIQAGTTVLATRVGPPDGDEAKHLGLESDGWTFRLDRLRFAAGLPLALEVAYLPCDLFPGLLDHPLVGSLQELLEVEYGVRRTMATEDITATAARRDAAAVLQVPPGAPLLSVTRISELDSGRVFEYSRELHRGTELR